MDGQGWFRACFRACFKSLRGFCILPALQVVLKSKPSVLKRMQWPGLQHSICKLNAAIAVRKDLQRSDKKQSKYKLNAAFAVRTRSGKICNGPTRSSQNTS